LILLRSHLSTKMLEVWDHYLKEIKYAVAGAVIGGDHFFQLQGLREKIDWVSKYGKYGLVRLYPNKVVKLKLVSGYLKAGEEFNSKLNQFLATATSENYQIQLYYAFDRWGLRKIPLDQWKHLGGVDVGLQKVVLDVVGEKKKDEIKGLIESWDKAFSVAKQIVSTLEAFSSENGIMPPKPTANVFG